MMMMMMMIDQDRDVSRVRRLTDDAKRLMDTDKFVEIIA